MASKRFDYAIRNKGLTLYLGPLHGQNLELELKALSFI